MLLRVIRLHRKRPQGFVERINRSILNLSLVVRDVRFSCENFVFNPALLFDLRDRCFPVASGLLLAERMHGNDLVVAQPRSPESLVEGDGFFFLYFLVQEPLFFLQSL